MSAFVDLVRFNPTLGGTTDWVYSSAVGGCQGPAAANTQNGVSYKFYAVSTDLTQWEIATGAYNSGTTTFPRTTVLYNSSGTGTAPGQSGAGTKINFSTVPQVSVIAIAEDVPSPAILRGYLSGLTLSTAGSSATFSVAAGVAVDGGNTDLMSLTSSISKTTSAWAVGSGNGGLDTGAIAASTWYHAYLIKRLDTLVVDVLVSLSASSPTLPANYTVSRRIGAMKTNGSSQWTLFTQFGDEFIWSVSVTDVNAQVPTSANRTLYTLTVPTGLQVWALFRLFASGFGVSSNVIVTSPDESDQAASGAGVGTVDFRINAAGDPSAGWLNRRTNTSAQIGVRSGTAAGSLNIGTYGWVDLRGKLS
jgi:hypothetical protein